MNTILRISSRTNKFSLSLCLVLLLLSIGTARAEHTSEPSTQEAPCMGDRGYHDTWLDRTHSFFTEQFCQPAVWFDNFFGDDRALDEGWPGSQVRLRSTYRVDERDENSYTTKINANIRLPALSDRLKLILTTKQEEENALVQADSDPIDQEVLEGEGGEASAGLRLHAFESQRARLTLGGGVRMGDPLDPYVRLRLRYTQPLGDSAQARFVPAVLATSEEDITRSFRLDLEQFVGRTSLFRLSQSLSRNDEEMGQIGSRWATQLSWLKKLSDKRALSVDLGQVGQTRPSTFATTYRIGSRLRVNFFRPWLYYEIEPEIYWPRNELDGTYETVHAISFRLEVQFFS